MLPRRTTHRSSPSAASIAISASRSIADSPKPPPERVTFSLPVVNAAREKIFVAMGSGKAEMTAKILKDAPRDGSVPAALVKGNVRWIVDDDAAALLSE